jgi:hypothetical protein
LGYLKSRRLGCYPAFESRPENSKIRPRPSVVAVAVFAGGGKKEGGEPNRRRRSRHVPHLKKAYFRLCHWNKKSTTTPNKSKPDTDLATCRHVPIAPPRKIRFDTMIAGDARFASSSRTACESWALGSCGSNAATATEPSPTIRPFAVPNKQFVTAHVLDTAKEFLGTTQSYRQSVCYQQKSVMYDEQQQNPLADRSAELAHSTLWRWLSWLGDLTDTLHAARQLLCQQDPSSTLHREVIPIDPKKYRSEDRRETLAKAADMLLAESRFESRLQKSIFPSFATAHGWR